MLNKLFMSVFMIQYFSSRVICSGVARGLGGGMGGPGELQKIGVRGNNGKMGC